jgi:putative tricarboxylic transport membrane protein
MSSDGQPSRQRRPDRAALVIAVVLAAVAIVIAWSTSNMDRAASYARVGPATFPYMVAAGLFVLSIFTVFAALRGDFPAREQQNSGPIVWIVGGLAAQMLLLDVAGFSVATGLLFAATARGFGKGPFWLTVPVGIVLAFVIWVIFAKGLQLSLPTGPLESLI